MQQSRIEKRLSALYTLCALCGAISAVTVGIAWGHWKQTLDQCQIGTNCSCILYGRHTPNVFLGGGTAPCVWVTFGPLFYVAFCIAMACFHGYRVAFSTTTQTRSMMTKSPDGGPDVVHIVMEQDSTSQLPRAFWITVTIFTGFWTLYCLVHFSIFVDGYYRTCNQYRKTLEKLLGLHGTATPVVHRRLSCHGIFDFMDYMQPDSGNAYRAGIINTGLDLVLGIVGAFTSILLFVGSTFLNTKMSRI